MTFSYLRHYFIAFTTLLVSTVFIPTPECLASDWISGLPQQMWDFNESHVREGSVNGQIYEKNTPLTGGILDHSRYWPIDIKSPSDARDRHIADSSFFEGVIFSPRDFIEIYDLIFQLPANFNYQQATFQFHIYGKKHNPSLLNTSDTIQISLMRSSHPSSDEMYNYAKGIFEASKINGVGIDNSNFDTNLSVKVKDAATGYSSSSFTGTNYLGLSERNSNAPALYVRLYATASVEIDIQKLVLSWSGEEEFPDTTPPGLTILGPSNADTPGGAVVNEANITLTGRAEDDGGIFGVTVDGNQVAGPPYNPSIVLNP